MEVLILCKISGTRPVSWRNLFDLSLVIVNIVHFLINGPMFSFELIIAANVWVNGRR